MIFYAKNSLEKSHNPEVAGSNPVPATTSERAPLTIPRLNGGVFVCLDVSPLLQKSYAALLVNTLITRWCSSAFLRLYACGAIYRG